MFFQVEVDPKDGDSDPLARRLCDEAREAGLDGVSAVRVRRLYLVEGDLTEPQVEAAARRILSDPILESFRIRRVGDAPLSGSVVTVLRRPGVMDPEGLTGARAMALLGHPGVEVRTGWKYQVLGGPSQEDVVSFVARCAANDVVDRILGGDQVRDGFPAPALGEDRVPLVAIRDASDEELDRISREGCLSLDPAEMATIREHFRELGREPTLLELETLAQTWSEHCKHKTFTGRIRMGDRVIDNLLVSTIGRATRELARPWCLSVFRDNAGVVAFDDEDALCFKVETHNHPSAIEPYGGAGTGLGGVLRDVLGCGLGARPILTTDVFCVAPPDLPADLVPPGMLPPLRILRSVVAGVRDYGNRVGVPTASGGLFIDPDYAGNPLVYCGCVGILPLWAVEKAARPGDRILLLGGRTGRDGIHGATFSSVELHQESEKVSGGAVQIGNALEEKKVIDVVLTARDRRLFRCITDCGAGGLSSAVGEMGEAIGAEVDLDVVPLKYAGLSPTEIWISEAQERMVLAVPPEHLEEVMELCASEDVEATDLGVFADHGRLIVRARGCVVGDLSMKFLHDGLPRPERIAAEPVPATPREVRTLPRPQDPGAAILDLLGDWDTCSREWIVRQYDHEVQGGSVVRALVGARNDGPGDGAVIRPKMDSRAGFAVACGMNPQYGRIDPYAMALAAVDEALRNVVAVGGDPDRTALLDNFSWGDCGRPEQLGALVRAAEGCYDAAVAYGAPFISGKDSLHNEYRVGHRALSIPPSLLISALSRVEDVTRCVTMDLKGPGHAVFLVGATRAEMGGSAYLRRMDRRGGVAPRPDLGRAPAVLRAVAEAIRVGLVRSCHDLSEGGLAVAAAEAAFAGDVGVEIDLGAVPVEGALGDAERLFSESCTRFLIEVESGRAEEFARRFGALPAARVGSTIADRRLRIRGVRGGWDVDVDLEVLRDAWMAPFSDA